MRKYIENPKTKGSGIICAIPQRGECPNNCEDCFFQSGRSYLEPLVENLPNMPSVAQARGRVVRVNDGNDSNVAKAVVMAAVQPYKMRFYNTAIPSGLGEFDAPVVLTVNPGPSTDTYWSRLEDTPKNLMFVRVRVNTWNLKLVERAVEYYSMREVPIVFTFMAYFTTYTTGAIPEHHRPNYQWRKRTLNSYWAIATAAWERVMHSYKTNKWVYSCGRIEGEHGTTACRHCGNCLREYFATMERMRGAG